MTTASEVIAVARSQVGICESPSGSNNQKYGIWYGMNHQPWCAMFVSWCFDQAGHPLPISTPKGFCYTPFGVNWAKEHGLWDEDGLYSPGDVIFYNFDSDAGPEHTGIVVADNGRTVTAIEGNTGGSSQSNGGEVCIKHRDHGPVVLGVLAASRLLATQSTPAVVVHTVPAFPLKAGQWYGVAGSDVRTHCGADPNDWYGITTLTRQLRARGWHSINVTQNYTPGVAAVVTGFQQDKKLTADGQVGPVTWRQLWEAPITP